MGYGGDKYMGPYKKDLHFDTRFSSVRAYKRMDESLNFKNSAGLMSKVGKFCCKFHRA